MQAFKNFRTYFFRGLAALLPTILTVWILVQCYFFVRQKIAVYINRGLVQAVVATVDWYPPVTDEQKRVYAIKISAELASDPKKLAARIDDEDIVRGTRIQVAEKYWVNGPGQVTGFIIAVIGVVFIGAFLASVMGRTLWRFFEKAFVNLPLVRQVYPYIKQITDFLLTKKSLSFNHVVAVQYPRVGMWSVGLVTGTGLMKIVNLQKKEYLTVFLPTSPTPFTGYVMITAKDETIELDMTIEEALRFTISGGVITPAENAAFRALANKDGVEDV
jgi:uncharacterized membrane protein